MANPPKECPKCGMTDVKLIDGRHYGGGNSGYVQPCPKAREGIFNVKVNVEVKDKHDKVILDECIEEMSLPREAVAIKPDWKMGVTYNPEIASEALREAADNLAKQVDQMLLEELFRSTV